MITTAVKRVTMTKDKGGGPGGRKKRKWTGSGGEADEIRERKRRLKRALWAWSGEDGMRR